ISGDNPIRPHLARRLHPPARLPVPVNILAAAGHPSRQQCKNEQRPAAPETCKSPGPFHRRNPETTTVVPSSHAPLNTPPHAGRPAFDLPCGQQSFHLSRLEGKSLSGQGRSGGSHPGSLRRENWGELRRERQITGKTSTVKTQSVVALARRRRARTDEGCVD